MMQTYYSNHSEKLSPENIASFKEKITNRDLDAWHSFMGNICQNASDNDYRNLTKDTLRLLFESSREDQAMQPLQEDDYRIIFKAIAQALEFFFDDDPVFLAISAHFHRDGRFGLHDLATALAHSTRAAEQKNVLGMIVLAYQYFYGQGVAQDKEKALDLVDQAILLNPIQGSATKALMFFRERNYSIAEDILHTIQEYKGSKFAALIDTTKAELAFQKNDSNTALNYLQQAVEYEQIAYADFVLGKTYLYGTAELAAEVEKGIYYLDKAVKKGAAYAGLVLGYYYCYNAPATDLGKGESYLAQAATYNDPYAKFELAKLFLYQEDFASSKKTQGVALLEAIKEVHHESYVHLAYLYLQGHVVPNKDLTKAHQYLEEAIDKGYGYAAVYLGKEYQNGTFNEQNDFAPQYEQALHWYEAGSELNEAEAVEMAGQYHRAGLGTVPNAEKALQYIQKGIQQFNSSFSKTELALCYESGFGVPQDYQKAFEMYLSACEADYPYACYRAGLYYRDGVHSEQNTPDFDKSFAAFSKAANLGYKLAEYEMAKATFYGEGVEQNVAKALEMYTQNLEDKIWDAAVDLGLYYEDQGENPAQAFHYLQKAADEAEIPFALFRLGLYYYQGFGTDENIDQAKKYFQLAVDHHYDAAYLRLGNIELWEEASDSNEANAFPYFAKAAEHEHYNEGLGLCYKYGIGVEKDASKAFEAFTKGTAANNITSAYYLGLCYLEGEGTTQNDASAFEHFQNIAEQYVQAKYQLAKLYLTGKGTHQNIDLGIQHLTQAAEADYTQAQFDLGNAYLTGNGVEENDELALQWYTKAADKGHAEALRIVRSTSNL